MERGSTLLAGRPTCGTLCEAVRSRIADGAERVVGVAFDGDADRALFVDETRRGASAAIT